MERYIEDIKFEDGVAIVSLCSTFGLPQKK